MSKKSRLHRPTPGKEIRVVLTPREFKDFQGACAVMALNIQAIQQNAAQQIAAAQAPKQKEFLRLVKKYRAAGLRPDVDYRFDEATRSLIAVK